MNTTTHALVAIAAFQKKSISRSGWACLIGSILPDAFLAVFIAVSISRNLTFEETWDVEYFQEPWVTTGAIFNSFPLWGLLLLAGYLLRSSSRSRAASELIMVVALSGLSHLVLDFFTHSQDAHQHFWPLTQWRFESPFSYWDVENNANFVMPVEGVIGLYSVKLLWERTQVRFFKVLLILLALISTVFLLAPLLRFIGS